MSIEGNQTHPLTRVAQDAKHCMALGAIEVTCLTRVAQDAKHCIALGAIELTHLTQVAQDAKHFMAFGAIKGNQTHYSTCSMPA